MKNHLKKSISFCLVFALLITSVSFNFTAKAEEPATTQTWNGLVSTEFGGGDGTQNNPYKILTAEQLAFLAQSVNGGETYLNQYFKLENNIKLNDISNFENWETETPLNAWTPIGSDTKYHFDGFFDGNGKTISGMFVNYGNRRGLFGVVGNGTNGTVTNLNITDSLVLAYSYSGLAVGEFSGLELSNITTAGKVKGTSSYHYPGGLVGSVNTEKGSVFDCVNNADAEGKVYVGGFTSYINKGVVKNCVNNGTVVNTGTSSGCTGGICYSNSGGTITDCKNTGSVTGQESTGGIAGVNTNKITRSFNTGIVKGTTYVGGICGKGNKATISECYNTGNVSGTSYTGGIVGLLGNELATAYNCTNMVKNCYNTASVSATGNHSGGIAGKIASYSYSTYVTNTTVTMCYNTGAVTAANYKGGIVGLSQRYNPNLSGSCNVTYCVYLSSCVTSPNNTYNYSTSSPSNIIGYTGTWGVNGSGEWKTSEAINGGVTPVLKWQKTDPPQYFTGSATLSGSAKIGDSLSVTVDELNPESENKYLKYTWYSDGVLIDNAKNQSTYTITADDLGHNISAIILSDGDYYGEIKTNQVFVPYEKVIWDGTAATKFHSGKGTSTDPYIIKTPHQLKYLSDVVNNGTLDTGEEYFKDKYYRLESDIYLNDLINFSSLDTVTNKKYWTPIGGQKKFALDPQPTSAKEVSGYMHNLGFVHENNTGLAYEVTYSSSSTYYRSFVFDGVFDGNGHTIYGMETQYVSSNYQGLFGVSCGAVRNITVDESYVKGARSVGGIVGLLTSWNGHFGIVENCTSNAKVYSSSYGAGGIIGTAISAESVACAKQDSMQITVENCKNYGTVEGYEDIGGIIGLVDRKYMNALNDGIEQQVVKYSTLYMTNCANFGTVGRSDRNQIGGLVGSFCVDYTNFNISKCYNEGYIFGNEYVAGLTGYINGWSTSLTHTFSCCYNIGPVHGNDYVGGLVGGAQYIYIISGELSSYDCVYFKSVYNAGRVTKTGNMGGALFGSTYGAENVPFFLIQNVYWLEGSALLAVPEGGYALPTFDSTMYVKRDDQNLVALLNENTAPTVWLDDTNNSNGGFPELVDGAENSKYFIAFSADEHDYVTPDKTLAARGETVNIITTQHETKAPFILVDGKEIDGYSFETSGEHIVHAEYKERIALPSDREIIVVPDTYVYDGYYKTPSVQFEGLVEGVDYTLSYSNNREPGTASVWVMGTGKYAGYIIKKFTIEKIPQAAPSTTPNLKNVTATSLSFEYVEGYEYKIDNGEWQTSSTFYDLQPATYYNVYWRLAESKYYAPGASSEGKLAKTYKLNATTPDAPTVAEVTDTTVLLNVVEGCEYKYSGGEWQSSAYFTGLSPETKYEFYQRKAETETTYESSSSLVTIVVTLKSYSPGDVDDNDSIDLNDVVCLAQYVAGWDVICNEKALDVNGNGSVDLNDVVHLAQYVAGWEGIILS